MGHGDKDPLVKYAWGWRTAEALRDLGYKVDFHTYKYACCEPSLASGCG